MVALRFELQSLGFGFAAGCEAAAMPAAEAAFYFWGYALGVASGPKSNDSNEGRSPDTI